MGMSKFLNTFLHEISAVSRTSISQGQKCVEKCLKRCKIRIDKRVEVLSHFKSKYFSICQRVNKMATVWQFRFVPCIWPWILQIPFWRRRPVGRWPTTVLIPTSNSYSPVYLTVITPSRECSVPILYRDSSYCSIPSFTRVSLIQWHTLWFSFRPKANCFGMRALSSWSFRLCSSLSAIIRSSASLFSNALWISSSFFAFSTFNSKLTAVSEILPKSLRKSKHFV